MSEAQEQRKTWRERFSDLFSQEPNDRPELLEMLKDANERQLLDGEALSMIHGALAVSDMHARDIMIPRGQLVTVGIGDGFEKILSTLAGSTHSRFPVIGDTPDDVRGILHAKDMLRVLAGDGANDFDIKDYIRTVSMVPESKRLNVLLQEFRAKKSHMAVVVDEYGNVSGVVTMEDVLEQIVGEIEDEYDIHDDSFIKAQDDGSYTVKATTPIEDFNEYFSCKFSDDEFDTVGGIVLKEFGHMPKREEVVTVGDFDFRVLNADSRRIRLLQLHRR